MADRQAQERGPGNPYLPEALRRLYAALNAEALAERQAQRAQTRANAHPLIRLLPDYKSETGCGDDPSPDATCAALYRYTRRDEASQERAHAQIVAFFRDDGGQLVATVEGRRHDGDSLRYVRA